MKIILSRKGFDSKYGGFPSPILPNEELISLPIPDQKDLICYSELQLKEYGSYFDIINQLKGKYHDPINGWMEITEESKCHLDPDIYPDIYNHKEGWSSAFGQIDAAQSHLENQGIVDATANDIFLFLEPSGRLRLVMEN
ncbi:MAG: hypothetical protein IPH84_18560 [Bacteroidales bacterium]|nr:hypothetical protein [Bacteroidales bacterium]